MTTTTIAPTTTTEVPTTTTEPPSELPTLTPTVYLHTGDVITGRLVGTGQKYGIYGESVQGAEVGPADVEGFPFGLKFALCSGLDLHDIAARACQINLHLAGVTDSVFTNLDLYQQGTTQDHCIYGDRECSNLRFLGGSLVARTGYGFHFYTESGPSSGALVEDYTIDAVGGRAPFAIWGWSNVTIRRTTTIADASQVCYRLHGTASNILVEDFEAWGGASLVGLWSGGNPTNVVFRNGTYHGTYLTPGGVPIPGVTFENVRLVDG